MLGGKFTGSNVSPTEGFVTLVEIAKTPDEGEWTELTFANKQPYRWVRYEAPPGSFGDIAEVQFLADKKRLSGPPIFSVGAITPTSQYKQAYDNKPESSFHSGVADGQYVGFDLGELASTSKPSMSPAAADYDSPQIVTLRSPTPGATIRYTLDGTTPGPNDGELYTKSITVDKHTTIVAVAFSPNLAPSVPSLGTWLVGPPVSKTNAFSIGNSLTGNAKRIPNYAHTAGRVMTYEQFLIGGSLTAQLWNAKETFDRGRWDELWGHATLPLDVFTVQPRDFNLDAEVEHELKFFDQIRATSPDVQPWIYAEWVEMRRERPSDKGESPTWQMKQTFPALSWEESMSAMLLYVEEVQHRVLEKYKGSKRPRIIPVSLAMGRTRNMIDRGELSGVTPGEANYYHTLFSDQVHVGANGTYLVDLMWYAAMFGESPEGKVLPIYTTFNATQAKQLQQLAWDIVQNYPDCGLYKEGTTAVASPQVAPTASSIADTTPISFMSTTPGAWFRYTLDGTTPTRTRGYVSCGKVTVRPGMMVKAIAYKSGMADSEVATFTFPGVKP